MRTPRQIRSEIQQYRASLAKIDGEREALEDQTKKAKKAMRKTLGCKPGGEQKAIEALRKKVAADQAELEELLDAVEGSE